MWRSCGPTRKLVNSLKIINLGGAEPYRALINPPDHPPPFLSTGVWVQQHEPIFCSQAWGFSNMRFSVPKVEPEDSPNPPQGGRNCLQGVPRLPTSTLRWGKVSPKTPQSRLKVVKSSPHNPQRYRKAAQSDLHTPQGLHMRVCFVPISLSVCYASNGLATWAIRRSCSIT